MIKSNAGANSVRQKMLLAVLLIFAVLTIGMITGCSGGKKDKGGETLEGFLGVYSNTDEYYNHYSNFTFNYGIYGGIKWCNLKIDDEIFAIEYYTEFGELGGDYNTIKIELLKEYPYYFGVGYYNSAGEYVDQVPAGDFDIIVTSSTPDLATVNKSTGSITAGSTNGTGTITITYKGLSYTFDFEIVSGFDMG